MARCCGVMPSCGTPQRTCSEVRDNDTTCRLFRTCRSFCSSYRSCRVRCDGFVPTMPLLRWRGRLFCAIVRHSTPTPRGDRPGRLRTDQLVRMQSGVGVQVTNVPLRAPFAKMTALLAPILAPLRLRRSGARASRVRVTPKASLCGRNSPNREAEGFVGKPGRLVAATVAALLLVRPGVLPGSSPPCRRVMRRSARRRASRFGLLGRSIIARD